jgi:hypothetical protein
VSAAACASRARSGGAGRAQALLTDTFERDCDSPRTRGHGPAGTRRTAFRETPRQDSIGLQDPIAGHGNLWAVNGLPSRHSGPEQFPIRQLLISRRSFARSYPRHRISAERTGARYEPAAYLIGGGSRPALGAGRSGSTHGRRRRHPPTTLPPRRMKWTASSCVDRPQANC